ncbi:MAG TPA: CARDB domain-containing protein [Candidatus Paceibacterota bacterium]
MNSFSVIPTAQTLPTSTIPISIVYIPTATSSPSVTGGTTLGLKTGSENLPPTDVVVVTPPPVTVEKPPVKKPETGLPDLSVRILSVGVIDPISGDIFARPPTSPNDLVAVSFDIANAGTASTGVWYFTAQLPIAPPYTFSSVAQISLAPGDHIENMLRFKQAVPGGNFSVAVDPANLVRETVESNNFAAQNI